MAEEEVYQGQVGERLARRRKGRDFLAFEEARAWARAQGLKGKKAWFALGTAGKRPLNIPGAPDQAKAYQGLWKGWRDWLGTEFVYASKRRYLPFEEARDWARAQKVATEDEWYALCKAGRKPDTIPAAPWSTYKEWQGLADWLGTVTVWTRNAIIAFLRDLEPLLLSFDPVELLKIMKQNGMLESAKEDCNSNRHLLGQIATCATLGDRGALADVIAQALAHPEDDDSPEGDEEEAEVLDLEAPLPADATADLLGEGDLDAIAQREKGLPAFKACNSLDAIDFTVQYAGPDAEAVEFFLANAVGKLWRQLLRDEGSFDLEALVQHPAGEYGAQVRSRFLAQLEGARGLPIPSGYRYPKNPNLMQRLIAYRLLTEQRLGNWSGTGAGKTLGALLASRVCDARLTVVIGLNSTIGDDPALPPAQQHGWAGEIGRAFPDTRILIKERGPLAIDPGEHTVLLLNFEAFQQPATVDMIRHLVLDHHIDMIVLDEIQCAKQRDKDESLRRGHLLALLSAAAEKNPSLRVLGMSATPVINNLMEARSLLEMIQGHSYPDLKTFPNLANVMALYEKLVVHGVRYRPQYSMDLEERHIPCDGDHLTDALGRVGKRDMLGMEQALLPAKLEAITQQLRPGTLLYSHYVDGIVPGLVQALRAAGFTVGTYVGDDRREDGFNAFVAGKLDVLIGSDKVQQGVDGLQERCNRLIIVTAPWTGAGYDQLVGRIYRQGSAFAKIEVLIPQVVIATDAELWSYDQWRHARIVSKKTLADAVTDGVMPQGTLESPQALVGRAQEALQGWIKRLEEHGLAPTIARPLLRVPLPEGTMQQARRYWEGLSAMNRLWATSLSRSSFVRDWLNHLRVHFGGRELFSVGEYWSRSVDDLHRYISDTASVLSLFDVPLHYNFRDASISGNAYDMRTILDRTLVKEQPAKAVTFVDNHDTQPYRSLESWVEPWFKPLAYALILLRREG